MNKDDLLRLVLEYDPTQDACLETGKDMDDPETSSLAFFKIHEDALLKRKLLEDRQDTYRSMYFTEYLKVAQSIGFTILYEIILKRSNKDKFVIMWREDGLLLSLDSFNQRINHSTLYFNWSGTDIVSHPPNGFSGRWVAEPYIYAGSYHTIEGLKYHIDLLYQDGSKPLKKWVENPNLYLVNWQETHDPESKDSDILTLMRIEKFPPIVREAIGFT